MVVVVAVLVVLVTGDCGGCGHGVGCVGDGRLWWLWSRYWLCW